MSSKSIDAFHRASSAVVVGVRHVFKTSRQLQNAIIGRDPFQKLGVPCHVSPPFLDNPNEPGYPFADNH